MKKYIGTKQVEAEPMTMGEAYEKGLLRGKPDEEYATHMGYHVKYQDGYESWSPKETFENAYRIAETALDRMLIEGESLTVRVEKLRSFMQTEAFSSLDETTKAMLLTQESIMWAYQHLLNLRHTKMESGCGGMTLLTFSEALILLRKGFAIRRNGWNGKGLFVVKQVPAHIDGSVIPKMQSLPQSAKDLIMNGKAFIDYTSQCLIYNENTGRADSWVPSVSDLFAMDWELVTL